MKKSSLSFSSTVLWLFFLFLLPTLAFGNNTQDSKAAKQAEELWEQAIVAKGGREQLYQVNSLLMSYQETVRNFLGIAVHRGVVERLYAFPDKSWAWDDGLPPPFRLTVGSLNLERNLRCRVSLNAAAPVCGPAKGGTLYPAEGLTQVQYLYLMETKWVKPIPVSVSKGNLGLKKVDVLRTRFENKRIDYFLDRKTHLPARVTLYYGVSDRATLTVDLSGYVTVSGIQMPGKQKRGKINFQINPLYDENIFSRPPSIDAGPQAWQRSAKPNS